MKKIKNIVASLPTKQRRRFILYYEYNLTYSEISKQEGCTNKAVRNTVMKAEEKIRKAFL